MTLNGVCVARAIERHLHTACLPSRPGTARGTLAGIVVAEAALDHSSKVTACFNIEANRKCLPPQAVAVLGANAVLRRKEARAGAE